MSYRQTNLCSRDVFSIFHIIVMCHFFSIVRIFLHYFFSVFFIYSLQEKFESHKYFLGISITICRKLIFLEIFILIPGKCPCNLHFSCSDSYLIVTILDFTFLKKLYKFIIISLFSVLMKLSFQ